MPTTTAPFIPQPGPQFGTVAYQIPSPLKQAQWSEARLGQECGLWLQSYNREAYDVWAHIPNGGLRTAKEGASFKAQHARAGYPDYFLAWAGYSNEYPFHQNSNGLYVELKTRTGAVKPEQKEWHERLRARGYRVEVIRSLPEFIALLTEYLA